jgi:flagellar motor switch protein FliN/FliY
MEDAQQVSQSPEAQAPQPSSPGGEFEADDDLRGAQPSEDAESHHGAEANPENSPLLGGAGDRVLEFLRDVPLQITVELGRTKMSIGELVNLGPSSVIELSKATDDPLDVRVNGVLIAHGEAVVTNERFGVRLTSVVESEALLESMTQKEST